MDVETAASRAAQRRQRARARRRPLDPDARLADRADLARDAVRGRPPRCRASQQIDTLTRARRRRSRSAAREIRSRDRADCCAARRRRQALGLELIASENFVSRGRARGRRLRRSPTSTPRATRAGATTAAARCVDEVEELAIERAKQLFGAEHANVQPHSGSQANEAVYRAVLEARRHDPRDEPRPRRPPHPRQPRRTSRASSTRSSRTACVRATEQIDYDQLRELAREHRPKLIQCGTTAYSRVIDFARFREIADEVGALLFADIAHIAGLVATGHAPEPGRQGAADRQPPRTRRCAGRAAA